jgi:hypothetical protein
MNKQISIISILIFFLNTFGFCQSSVDTIGIDKFKTDSINGIYIPKDLNDCFTQIDGFWNDSLKNQVKLWTEDEFCGNAHFGFGMWMRNNWGLWSGSRLKVYFNDTGIYHPDDMSGIILTSYHRYLTGKKVDLKKQLKQSKAYWEKSQSPSKFEAKTNGNLIFTDIDTALLHTDSIVDIKLIGYEKLPKRLNQFNNLSKLTIENCLNLDFLKAIEAIVDFQELTELYLFENKRKGYPSNLGEISNLKKLWISGDSLTHLPNEVKKLNELNELIITKCPNIILDTLFLLLSKVTSLRELDLSENTLTEIPVSIGKLTQLTDLWFDENQLTEIPQGVKSLPNLDYLRLFSNNIKSLSLKSGDLPNLTHINLCYNSFETFPMELSKINKLKKVTIWYSEISVIPDEITIFKGLEYLNLQGNNLTDDQKDKLKFQLPETELKL